MKAISGLKLGLIAALLTGSVVACAPAQAGERTTDEGSAAPTTASLASVGTAAATPDLTPTHEATATVPTETAVQAAERFAAAMVSGDLTALTLSFAPAGLAQARLLASQNGVEGAGEVSAAAIHSARELADPVPTWEVVLAISATDESFLNTRWRWFDSVGWRIVGLEPGSAG